MVRKREAPHLLPSWSQPRTLVLRKCEGVAGRNGDWLRRFWQTVILVQTLNGQLWAFVVMWRVCCVAVCVQLKLWLRCGSSRSLRLSVVSSLTSLSLLRAGASNFGAPGAGRNELANVVDERARWWGPGFCRFGADARQWTVVLVAGLGVPARAVRGSAAVVGFSPGFIIGSRCWVVCRENACDVSVASGAAAAASLPSACGCGTRCRRDGLRANAMRPRAAFSCPASAACISVLFAMSASKECHAVWLMNRAISLLRPVTLAA